MAANVDEVYGAYTGDYGGNLSLEEFSEFWSQTSSDDKERLLSHFKAEGSHCGDPIPTNNGMMHLLTALRVAEMLASK